MTITYSKKKWIFIFISIIIILVGKFISPITALTNQGNTALFFMLGILVILITEALPAGLIGFVGMVFLPVLGLVNTLNDAAKLFASQLFFYFIAVFTIAAVMDKMPITKRLLLFFLKHFNKSTKQVVMSILATATILSSFLSNFVACLLMLILSREFTNIIEDEAERTQTKKSLMVGIVIAVSAGGIATPIGNTGNVIASGILAQMGMPITFIQWMAFGVPIMILSYFLLVFLVLKILPPVEQSEETRIAFAEKVRNQIPEKMSFQEKLAIIILVTTLICWILNFNIMMISCFCAVALLFPGFKILSWDEFNKQCGWATILMVLTLIAIAAVLQTTGVIAWVMGFLKAIIPAGVNIFVLMLIFGFFTLLLLFVLPNGPAIMSILSATIVILARGLGINPVTLLVGFAFFTSYLYIIPIDGISLISYDEGKGFKPIDQVKVGIPMTIGAIVITSICMPVIGKLLGF